MGKSPGTVPVCPSCAELERHMGKLSFVDVENEDSEEDYIESLIAHHNRVYYIGSEKGKIHLGYDLDSMCLCGSAALDCGPEEGWAFMETIRDREICFACARTAEEDELKEGFHPSVTPHIWVKWPKGHLIHLAPTGEANGRSLCMKTAPPCGWLTTFEAEVSRPCESCLRAAITEDVVIPRGFETQVTDIECELLRDI